MSGHEHSRAGEWGVGGLAARIAPDRGVGPTTAATIQPYVLFGAFDVTQSRATTSVFARRSHANKRGDMFGLTTVTSPATIAAKPR